jgi:hypothetical protein
LYARRIFTPLNSKAGEHTKHSVFHIKHFISKDLFFDRWGGCDETDFVEDLIDISLQIGKRRVTEREREITSEPNFWKAESLC